MTKVEERFDLITRGVWDYKDIMAYFPQIKSPSTAEDIKRKAQKYCDGASYSSRLVTVDAVFKYMKIDRKEEITLLKKIISEESNDDKELL